MSTYFHIPRLHNILGMGPAIGAEMRHEKTNVLVSDLVRHKPGCTATEES